jgi:hypothetical protein
MVWFRGLVARLVERAKRFHKFYNSFNVLDGKVPFSLFESATYKVGLGPSSASSH